MKRYVLIITILALAVCAAGCGKKQESLEQMQEPMSMEALSSLKADRTQAAAQEGQAPAAPAESPASQLEPLPPSGPFSPSVTQIQAALKHAGYYTGAVDGKAGPRTKAAIEAFQKDNQL